jgi:hypothetical protein
MLLPASVLLMSPCFPAKSASLVNMVTGIYAIEAVIFLKKKKLLIYFQMLIPDFSTKRGKKAFFVNYNMYFKA